MNDVEEAETTVRALLPTADKLRHVDLLREQYASRLKTARARLAQLLTAQQDDIEQAVTVLTEGVKAGESARSQLDNVTRASMAAEHLLGADRWQRLQELCTARDRLRESIRLLKLFHEIPTRAKRLREEIDAPQHDARHLRSIFVELTRLVVLRDRAVQQAKDAGFYRSGASDAGAVSQSSWRDLRSKMRLVQNVADRLEARVLRTFAECTESESTVPLVAAALVCVLEDEAPGHLKILRGRLRLDDDDTADTVDDTVNEYVRAVQSTPAAMRERPMQTRAVEAFVTAQSQFLSEVLPPSTTDSMGVDDLLREMEGVVLDACDTCERLLLPALPPAWKAAQALEGLLDRFLAATLLRNADARRRDGETLFAEALAVCRWCHAVYGAHLGDVIGQEDHKIGRRLNSELAEPALRLVVGHVRTTLLALVARILRGSVLPLLPPSLATSLSRSLGGAASEVRVASEEEIQRRLGLDADGATHVRTHCASDVFTVLQQQLAGMGIRQNMLRLEERAAVLETVSDAVKEFAQSLAAVTCDTPASARMSARTGQAQSDGDSGESVPVRAVSLTATTVFGDPVQETVLCAIANDTQTAADLSLALLDEFVEQCVSDTVCDSRDTMNGAFAVAERRMHEAVRVLSTSGRAALYKLARQVVALVESSLFVTGGESSRNGMFWPSNVDAVAETKKTTAKAPTRVTPDGTNLFASSPTKNMFADVSVPPTERRLERRQTLKLDALVFSASALEAAPSLSSITDLSAEGDGDGFTDRSVIDDNDGVSVDNSVMLDALATVRDYSADLKCWLHDDGGFLRERFERRAASLLLLRTAVQFVRQLGTCVTGEVQYHDDDQSQRSSRVSEAVLAESLATESVTSPRRFAKLRARASSPTSSDFLSADFLRSIDGKGRVAQALRQQFPGASKGIPRHCVVVSELLRRHCAALGDYCRRCLSFGDDASADEPVFDMQDEWLSMLQSKGFDMLLSAATLLQAKSPHSHVQLFASHFLSVGTNNNNTGSMSPCWWTPELALRVARTAIMLRDDLSDEMQQTLLRTLHTSTTVVRVVDTAAFTF